MVVPLASPPSGGEMRRNFSKRTPGTQPCQTCTPVQTQRSLYQPYQSVAKCSRRRSGLYCKPLGFEDVAHLKVVWNLLIPPGDLDCRTREAMTAGPQFTATKALALGKRPNAHYFDVVKSWQSGGGTIPSLCRSRPRCCQGSV